MDFMSRWYLIYLPLKSFGLFKIIERSIKIGDQMPDLSFLIEGFPNSDFI